MSVMKSTVIAAVSAGLTLLALAAQPAVGQGAASGLQGHDTNAPVDVAAQRIEIQDRADRAVFVGNVEVRQGALQLNSARLTVAYSKEGGIEIDRLDASGGVRLTSPSESASGQFAIYDLNRRLITMIGDVTLTRGANKVNGNRLVLDLTTGRAVIDGGGSAAPGTQSQGGRVTGTFTVPQRRD